MADKSIEKQLQKSDAENKGVIMRQMNESDRDTTLAEGLSGVYKGYSDFRTKLDQSVNKADGDVGKFLSSSSYAVADIKNPKSPEIAQFYKSTVKRAQTDIAASALSIKVDSNQAKQNEAVDVTRQKLFMDLDDLVQKSPAAVESDEEVVKKVTDVYNESAYGMFYANSLDVMMLQDYIGRYREQGEINKTKLVEPSQSFLALPEEDKLLEEFGGTGAMRIMDAVSKSVTQGAEAIQESYKQEDKNFNDVTEAATSKMIQAMSSGDEGTYESARRDLQYVGVPDYYIEKLDNRKSFHLTGDKLVEPDGGNSSYMSQMYHGALAGELTAQETLALIDSRDLTPDEADFMSKVALDPSDPMQSMLLSDQKRIAQSFGDRLNLGSIGVNELYNLQLNDPKRFSDITDLTSKYSSAMGDFVGQVKSGVVKDDASYSKGIERIHNIINSNLVNYQQNTSKDVKALNSASGVLGALEDLSQGKGEFVGKDPSVINNLLSKYWYGGGNE